MSERDRARERDLVLAPNEYAFIADETKGNINAYVGPYKSSLANTDQPVAFNATTKRFERCSLEVATMSFAVAPVGWYLMLKNPARDRNHPKTGAINNLAELEIGRKVNLPGPAAFALWPGQMVRVLQGHHLRSNQYLLVRVYDEEAAKANWKNAVIKPQTPGEDATTDIPDLPDLTMGKLLVIKGTDVSFYIPPTGIEVVPDQSGSGDYVRNAVTLERLEYCILLDESGNKSYLQGPAVVFPRPTEVFVERNAARKFRAIELSENSGIYLKVIAPYAEDADFRAAFREAKHANKIRLRDRLRVRDGIELPTDHMLDVMVKRLHEYKRQTLKLLHIVSLYEQIISGKVKASEVTPRSFVFGAKAAPGYRMAKQIIHLINAVGSVVNSDPLVEGRLNVFFPANYNVTLAERLIPGFAEPEPVI